MRPAVRRAAAAAALLVLLGEAPVVSAAEEPACAPIQSILEAAQRGWRSLKTEEYSTQFESWQSRQTLPGYESCWVDDVSHRFWCMNRAPTVDAAGKAAAQQVETIERCWPGVPSMQTVETGDNNVTRLIQDWTLATDRRLRLVQRKPTRGTGLSSVFLYVY